jgi:nucleoside-diphosphate-sugar epimerase
MKKKILITGCGGYLGSYLIPFLLQKKKYLIQGYDIGFFKECNLFENKNLSDLINLKDAKDITLEDLQNCDIVIHLAGISNDPLNKLTSAKVYDPTREYTLNIAKICKSLNKKFIFTSSCSVFGAAKTENYLTETSETSPQTGYSLNKLQIEDDLRLMSDFSFSPICLRFATIFGVSSRIRFDVVINMLVGMALTQGEIKLNSNGEAWRPHLYIEDACSAILHFIEYEKKNKDGNISIINIGRNDNNIKIIDVAKIIQELVPGTKIKFINNSKENLKEQLFIDRKIKKGHDSRTYKVLFDQSENKYGFKCKYTVKDGISEMIDNFSKFKFDDKIFKFKGFYRLQYLESLYEKNLIDDNLKWKI